MVFNQRGKDLIKQFEGLSLTVYLCPAGLPTVGWGHMDKSLKVGDKITKGEAEALLDKDLKVFIAGVNALVRRSLSDNAFSALVSFAFNVGLANFAASTMLKKINAGEDASGEFERWVKVKGKVSNGLVRRRQAERDLFLA